MRRTVGSALVVVLVGACSGGEPPATAAGGQRSEGGEAVAAAGAGLAETLPNGAAPEEGLYTAGALSPEDLDAARAAGVRTVIDLQTPAEKTFDERAAVQERGMQYVSIEVAGPAGLTRANVEALDAALEGEGPFLVHCGSSNRVGALFALRAAWLQGEDEEAALEVGRARGLTKLEPAVRERLQTP